MLRLIICPTVSSDADTPIDDIANSNSDFCCSRWFTRGWTLQELIAPSNVVFYNRRWDFIRHKHVFGWGDVVKRGSNPVEVSILTVLRQITNMPLGVLAGHTHPKSVSIATRMTWAARRQTTRREDIAYCLLSLFNINMTMLYGEGHQAFRRLQEEIIRTSDDESIFAWGFGCAVSASGALHSRDGVNTLLASSLADFSGCEDVRPLPLKHEWGKKHATHYVLTNKGLLVERPILTLPSEFNTSLLPLNCCVAERWKDRVFTMHTTVEDLYPQVLALRLGGVLSQDARLEAYTTCRVIPVDFTMFQRTPPGLLNTKIERIYVDMS